MLSVIIPVLNEAGTLPILLRHLQPWRTRGCELIVVDGGSHDDSRAVAAPLADQVMALTRQRLKELRLFLGGTAPTL